jgi:hypothetical protein
MKMTQVHVNTQHAHLPTDAQAKEFDRIVKAHGGEMDGATDKGVLVTLPEAQVRSFTRTIQATFKNVWIDTLQA